MTLLQTIDNDIIKANNRMNQIVIEKKILDKEYDLVNEKKWELESYRDLLIQEADNPELGGDT